VIVSLVHDGLTTETVQEWIRDRWERVRDRKRATHKDRETQPERSKVIERNIYRER
jgi:hypothetical protein